MLEYKTLPSNNGNQPKQIPYRWLCGRDRHGNQVNPSETKKLESIQYIAAVRDKVTNQQNEWQGALPDHPAVADAPSWASPPLLVDLSLEAIEARIAQYIALTEDKSARETQICESESMPTNWWGGCCA